jgi:L-iditol 2-dehydrogenase
MAHPVPDSMSDEAAALLEPLSVAITTMRKAHVTGSSMLIAGAGPMWGDLRTGGPPRCARSSSRSLASRRERVRAWATEVLDPTTDDVAALDPQVDAFVEPAAPPAVVSGIQAVIPADTSCWSEWAPATSPRPSATSRTWSQRDRSVPIDRLSAAYICVLRRRRLDALVTGRYDLPTMSPTP